MEWFEFLERQVKRNNGIMPFFIQKCICQKVWHQVLRRYAGRFDNPRILETGCGFAWDSIYLSYFFKDVYAIDTDKRVAEEAAKINEYLNGSSRIIWKDMFNITGSYNLIFSNGTYEHYSKDKITELIRLHINKADYLIFCVPLNTDRDKEPFNNELLIPEREWRKIINKSGGRIREIYGLDFPRFLAFATYIPLFSRILRCFSNYRIFVVTLDYDKARRD